MKKNRKFVPQTFVPEGDLSVMGLGRAVAIELGLPLAQGPDVVKAVLEVIGRTVAEGYTVKLGNFGTFQENLRNVPAPTGFAGREKGVARGVKRVRHIRFRASGELYEAMLLGKPYQGLSRDPKTVQLADEAESA